MSEHTDRVVVLLLIISFAFGLVLGCVGLGIGLVFATLQQAIGLGILSIGFGALYGMSWGARRILKALIETMKEMEAKS